MEAFLQRFIFEQIHIEIARNATDDFNLFHDKNKWHRVRDNPFEGPIALGFQLEALIEKQVEAYQHTHGGAEIIDQHCLRYSSYEFTFASVVRPGCPFSIDIKPARLKTSKNTTFNQRVCVKTEEGLALIGYKRESFLPLYLPEVALPDYLLIEAARDRSYLPGTRFFLKKKYMNTSNAKNFLTGSLVEQADYFDELEDIAHFPGTFPCSLISCALLESARHDGHDFEENPMVYTSHKICLDRDRLAELKSNDALYILVKARHAEKHSGNNQHDTAGTAALTYECYGLLKGGVILFRALIALTPLSAITSNKSS